MNRHFHPIGRLRYRLASVLFQLTSRLRRELAYQLPMLQGFALISPFEGFSQRAPRMLRKRAVEVTDEFKDAGFQLSNASEIGTPK